MGNIVLLDELTINKMAAGEVIERPANVVKELVENSIDAGATNVVIEIKKGGKSLIKITDNGKGIARDDMEISLERHATSKIRRVEDLEETYTMGFRGEALASISSISKLTMISRTKQDEIGIKLVAEGGNIIEAEEVGVPVGTTMMVENLFFNTPVRYKFLKQDATEFRFIKEWVQKAAMANLDVAIKLISDGKEVFKSNGSGKLKDIIYLIYGKDVSDNINEIDYQDGEIIIKGYVGNTLISRDSRKDQIVFLNKRNIKNKVVTNSADQSFKASIGIGKFGFYILDITMPANMYDVNVHPTKMEVRFKDEEHLYKIIYHALKNAMLEKSFLGNEDIENKDEYIENEYKFLTNNFKKEESETREEATGLINRETKRKIDYKYLGIFFKTFITAEIGDDIYFIDQHAAHERLLYEKIRENYKNKIANNTQMLLLPDIIELSHKEFEFVKDNIELFKKVGFELEMFGANSVKINGKPDLDYKTNSKNIFMDILDEMITNERSASKDIEERFIATVACKAAVKAGMNLKQEEVDYLIQELLILQNPYTCPHGRPTTIKLNRKDIMKGL